MKKTPDDIELKITALADNELQDAIQPLVLETVERDSKLSVLFDIQFLIGDFIRKDLTRHPIPFGLNAELLKFLHKGD